MWVLINKISGDVFGPFDDGGKAWEWQLEYSNCLDNDDLARHMEVWRAEEVTFTSHPHDQVQYTTHRTFGPGKLESIDLYIWRDGTAKVEGDYRVYCGAGNDHTFHADSGFIPADSWTEYRKMVAAAYGGQFNLEGGLVDYDAVVAVIEEILNEEWSDPCLGEPDDTPEGFVEEVDLEPLPCAIARGGDIHWCVVHSAVYPDEVDGCVSVFPEDIESDEDDEEYIAEQHAFMHAPARCPECGEDLVVMPEGATEPAHVFCDICSKAEHPADLTEDWNGETGNHLSCEAAQFIKLRDETN